MSLVLLMLPALLMPLLPAPASAGEAPKFHLKKPAPGTPVDVLARRIIYDGARDVATALGDVRITWGPYVLLARKVVYNRRTDRFQAEGEVHLREPEGNVLLADLINIDDKFREGFARHLRLIMTNGAELKARYAVRREGNITIYEDVEYTACKTCRTRAGAPLWKLKSKQATHDQQKGRIYHKDMTFEVAGVPVLWLPWLSHPDPQHPRATGFLFPSVKYSKKLGLGVRVPYFINLAPHYDITLLPTFYTRQGVLGRAVWRHHLGSGAYEVDAGGIRQLSRKRLPAPGDRKWRWFARTKGEFAFNTRWKWGFEGAVQSDRAMMRTYDIDSRDMIHSRLWLSGLDGRNWFYAETGHFRGLRDADTRAHDPRTLPWVEYEYAFAPPVLGGALKLATSVQSILRKREHTPFTSVHQAEQQVRLASRLSWRREFITSGGIVLDPYAELRSELRFARDLPDPAAPGGVRDKETTMRLVPLAALDARWPWLATFDGGQHIITPVAQLAYAPRERKRNRISNEDAITAAYSASSLFLHDRFSGLDRHEGGLRANLGLAYSLLWDDGGFLRASLGGSYHLAGENSYAGTRHGLSGRRGDWVAGIAYAPVRSFLLSWQGRFDAKTLAPRDQEARLKLQWDKVSLSASYARFRADDAHGIPETLHQVFTEGSWRFAGNWVLFGAWNYDIRRKRLLERSIGIGYECDCTTLRIKYSERHARDYGAELDRSISLTIRLHTLGGNGPDREKPVF